MNRMLARKKAEAEKALKYAKQAREALVKEMGYSQGKVRQHAAEFVAVSEACIILEKIYNEQPIRKVGRPPKSSLEQDSKKAS